MSEHVKINYFDMDDKPVSVILEIQPPMAAHTSLNYWLAQPCLVFLAGTWGFKKDIFIPFHRIRGIEIEEQGHTDA